MMQGGYEKYVVSKHLNPRSIASSYTSQGAPHEPSSTSSWDVGNPKPTNTPSDEGEKDNNEKQARESPNSQENHSGDRPIDSPTPSLEKETSAREFFHVKAKETEDRLHEEEEEKLKRS